MTNLEDEEEVGKKVEIEITNPVENAETNQRIFYNDLIIYGNHLQNKKPYKMGNLYTFFYYKEMPLIVIGTNKLSLIITHETFVQITFWLIIYYAVKLNSTIKFITKVLYSVTFISHIIIILINPGIPSKKHFAGEFRKTKDYINLSNEKKRNVKFCEICNIIVLDEDYVEHCEECNICIKKYDHHCYWTGKCISNRNKIFFYSFLFGTFSYCIWFFIDLIIWLYIFTFENE